MADVFCIACGEPNPPWYRACKLCDAVLLHNGPIPDPPAPPLPPLPPTPSLPPEQAPRAEFTEQPESVTPPAAPVPPSEPPQQPLIPQPTPAQPSVPHALASSIGKRHTEMSPRERALLARANKSAGQPTAGPLAGSPPPLVAPAQPQLPPPLPSTPTLATVGGSDQSVTLGDPLSAPVTAASELAPPDPTTTGATQVRAVAPPVPPALTEWSDEQVRPTGLPDLVEAPKPSKAKAPVLYSSQESTLRRVLPLLVLLLLLAIIAVAALKFFLGDDGVQPAGTAGGPGAEEAEEVAPGATLDVSALLRNAEPSIAFVASTGCDASRKGSGFFVREDMIVTSASLVAGDAAPMIIGFDGVEHQASIIAIDDTEQLALLRIDGTNRAIATSTEAVADGSHLALVHDDNESPGASADLATVGVFTTTPDATGVVLTLAADVMSPEGSAVVNAGGRVVGMTTTIMRAGLSATAIVPASTIEALVTARAGSTDAVTLPCAQLQPSDDWSSPEFGAADTAPGSDIVLDALYEACSGNDLQACDDLAVIAPEDSEYSTFGSTCAGATESSLLACTAIVGDEQVAPQASWTYGDCVFLPRGSVRILRLADCDLPHDAEITRFAAIEGVGDDVETDCAANLPDSVQQSAAWNLGFSIGGLVIDAEAPMAACFIYVPGPGLQTYALAGSSAG